VADIDDDGNTAETLPWDRDNEKPLSQWGRFFDVASGPGGSVDMGAYENQHIADCPWDISSSGYTAPPDGDVGNPDFLMLIAEWGSCPGCGADFSCDGSVSSVDYNELLANWGSCPGGGDSPQGGGDSSLEEALEAMGFYDLADYQTWLSGATDEEAYASAVELALLLSE
jgi:hypothetical protein